MLKFHFGGTNADGASVSGLHVSASLETAREELEQQGITLKWLVPPTAGGTTPVEDDAVAESPPNGWSTGTAAGGSRVAEGISSLISGRLPLPVGLRLLAEECPSRAERRAMVRAAERLEAGATLPEVVRELGAGLPTTLGLLLSDKLTISQMDILLRTTLAAERNRISYRDGFVSTIVPISLYAIGAAGLFVAALGLIVPIFKSIMTDFGTAIPAMTKLFFAISGFVTSSEAWIVVGCLVLATLAFRFLLQSAVGREFIFSLPWIGRLMRLGVLSTFCDSAAVGLRARRPIAAAFVTAGKSVHDFGLEAAGRQLAEIEQSGQSLKELTAVRGLPRELTHVLHWADDPAAVAESLEAAGQVYRANGLTQMALASAHAGPLILVVVTVFTGLLVVGMFMPLIKLLNDLS